MGKKARSNKGQEKAKGRKLDKSQLPPPPAALEDEIGSAKLLKEAKIPGSSYKALDRDGYDDGGVADLTLVIDLEDHVLRRKRGDAAYFAALKSDLLPRVTTTGSSSSSSNGSNGLAHLTRRDQKIKLAKLLFSEDDEEEEDANPSEVYTDNVDGTEDEATKTRRLERLKSAKFALRLSTVLREPACASLSLSETSKRYLSCYGKEGAEAALRCAVKAIEVASEGFYDSDDIAIEAEEEPKVDPKHEKNATYPGLSHESTLKLQPIRVSQLCLRSAYLHRGNALSALGREDEAREFYLKVLPMLEDEPRCGRLDWERSSIHVNVGNTYSRQGDYDKANDQYKIVEKLGKDHLEVEDGNKADGLGIMILGMRARAFALQKAGKDEEGKLQMKDVIQMQQQLDVESAKEKEKQKKLAEEQAAKEAESASEMETETDSTPSTLEIQ